MVFSTIIFLFRFLPITLALYYLAPAKLKNTVLFLCSLVFYCWGEVRFFPVMVALILINYVCGLAIEHFDAKPALRKVFLLIALIGSLGMLFYFKYANFVLRSANALLGTAFAEIQGIGTLPLGISFYTFQTLSYSIDVYRRDVKAERNIIDFGAYVVMFPQLIAGPIVKYRDVSNQLHVYRHRYNLSQIEEGMTLFTFGLAKKVLLADAIGALWTDIIGVAASPSTTFVGLANASTPLAWLGIIAYSLQLYFDFAGYSEMSNGLAALLGFDCPANFNLPYISGSITEFWRRWHITLSGWFRDYIYIPLGGNRKGQARQLLNMFLVWAATGIWHGASWNFIAWGLYYFVLLTIEKNFLLKYLKKGKVWPHIYTLFFVVLGWGIFTANQPGAPLGLLLQKLFVPQGGISPVYYLRNYGVLLAVSVVTRFTIQFDSNAIIGGLAVGENQQKYCGKAPCVCPADRAVRLLRSGRHERYRAVREFLRGGTDKCQRLCTVKTAADAVRGIRCWCSAPCCCSGSPSSILCGPSARSSSWKTARPHSSRRSA